MNSYDDLMGFGVEPLSPTERRTRLLEAGARVARNITSILDLDELLVRTVDIICDEYGFYYAAIFLLDEEGKWAVLRAGRGEAGRRMLETGHKLEVGGNSMIGAATGWREALIALDVGKEAVRFDNPLLPLTRSEMALPLIVGDKVIGALGVQSTERAAFSEDDITSLQIMADQLAIAINNTYLVRDLEKAHEELLRVKTFETLANATIEAIHWIGNKASPVPACVGRVREDMLRLVYAVNLLIDQESEESQKQVLARLFREFEAPFRSALSADVRQEIFDLQEMPLEKARRVLSMDSIFEDLAFIGQSAKLILDVRESLIGPAREQKPRPVMLQDVFKDTAVRLGIPPGIMEYRLAEDLPLALADSTQMSRVFANILKNALEAMAEVAERKITVEIEPDKSWRSVVVKITDNGCGIPASELDKIWVAFYTTKDASRHAGLGLSACLRIMEEMRGRIDVESEPGVGAAFTVTVPASVGEELQVDGPCSAAVLILDDDDVWRRFAASTLEEFGCRVTVAEDQADYGISQLRSRLQEFDLVVVDDALEHLDAITMLRAIMEAGGSSKTVVVASSMGVERTRDEMQMGIIDVLPKPYTRAELLTAVQRVAPA
jgi:signal transduction histidine kinase/CheY-like chemotaxis protein